MRGFLDLIDSRAEVASGISLWRLLSGALFAFFFAIGCVAGSTKLSPEWLPYVLIALVLTGAIHFTATLLSGLLEREVIPFVLKTYFGLGLVVAGPSLAYFRQSYRYGSLSVIGAAILFACVQTWVTAAYRQSQAQASFLKRLQEDTDAKERKKEDERGRRLV